jgi:hypothetical protein
MSSAHISIFNNSDFNSSLRRFNSVVTVAIATAIEAASIRVAFLMVA